MNNLSEALRQGLNTILEWIYPPKCMLCGSVMSVGQRIYLCPHCEGNLEIIGEPACARCGAPLENEENFCLKCRMQDFPFVSNTALLLYDAFTKSIIYKFKYGDKPGCARSLAALAYRHLAGVFDGADVMVPVPLYPGKRRRRGYNQAELLARELSKLCGAPVEPRALVRVRSTMPQARLNRAERENNVRGAFKANEKLKLKLILKGKKILLIDDIYTTGSTLCACAEAMREFDNVETRCFTLALAPADGGKYFES